MRGNAQSQAKRCAMLRPMAVRSNAKTAPKRSRLLYVGDDGASLEVLKQVITGRENLALWRAADIDTALQLALRQRPEVMFVDVDPAASGGLPLIRMLRANAATRATAILAIGSDAAPQAARNSVEAGYFEYLARPVQAAALRHALDYALEFTAVDAAEQADKESR